MAPQFNIPAARGLQPINANLPNVDFNPAPQANFIDSALQGLERGQTMGLRARQQAIQEQQAQRLQQQFEAEQKQKAIENLKVKSEFYNAKWFKGLSQEDKNKFHKSFIQDLGSATGLEVDPNSTYHDNDSETAAMLGDLFSQSGLSENDRRTAAASIIAEAQKRGSDKEYLDELRKTAELGVGKDNSYQWANIALRQRAMDDKQAGKDQKTMLNNQAAIDQANRIIGKVDEAMTKVSGSTAGAMARSAAIPGTPARNLRADLQTIKANLGFAELQAMRAASPTGGALGQIAVQELENLQSTIASLDQEQSPEQLKNSLQQVRTHYANWKKAVEQSMGGEPAPTSVQNSVTFIDSDGEQHTIPAANLNAARQRDPGLKVVQ